jgi:hypothetical protein
MPYRTSLTAFRVLPRSIHYSRQSSITIELGLHVYDHSTPIFEQRCNDAPPQTHIDFVQNRQDHSIGRKHYLERHQPNPIFVHDFARQRQAIVHLHRCAERLKLTYDVNDSGIANIGDI